MCSGPSPNWRAAGGGFIEMARTLFKSWFIDFDPVCAKGYDRDLYLAQEFLALFPESFDNEDWPQGWSAKPLDEVAEFLNGLAMQKFPPFEVSDSLSVIKISELRSGITSRSAERLATSQVNMS